MTIINTQDGNPVTPTNPLPVTLYAADGTVLLGTPVAAGDALANPTAARLLAFPHLFDGTTWQRQRLAEAIDGSTVTGIPGTALVARQGAGTGYYRVTSPEPSAAALTAEKLLGVAPMLRAAANDFQPMAANQFEIGLVSAARTCSARRRRR
ncbi:MAG: hypothetical protein FJ033_13885 [Chloroflexi bacterium]|nr:hypothetical protein [Chloroflexota bacterium]